MNRLLRRSQQLSNEAQSISEEPQDPLPFRLSENVPPSMQPGDRGAQNPSILGADILESASIGVIATKIITVLIGCVSFVFLLLIPAAAYRSFPTQSSTQDISAIWSAFVGAADYLSSEWLREKLWVAENTVAMLALSLAFVSWRRRPRPEDASVHRAWVKELMQAELRDTGIKFMVTIIGFASGAIACLYWFSLIVEKLLGHADEMVIATLLAAFSFCILVLSLMTSPSKGGGLIGYARSLSNFTYLTVWWVTERKRQKLPNARELGRRKWCALSLLFVRYVLVGPAILATWRLFVDVRTQQVLQITIIVAMVIGVIGLCFALMSVTEIPGVIMHRNEGVIDVWLPLLFLMGVVVALIGAVSVGALEVLCRFPTWGDFFRATIGWAVCLHWIAPLFGYCLGRLPKCAKRRWVSRCLGLNSLEVFVDISLHSRAQSTLREIIEYECESPSLEVSSEDLDAIVNLIVPAEAVIVDSPASEASDCRPNFWQWKVNRLRNAWSNSWWIDPNRLIADRREKEGVSLRQALCDIAESLQVKENDSRD
ncbi:hypothetical protein ACSL103130_11340 [Actinomyces slackii]|uniref:Uncharacterized protein n=2 Tax=Actinomyces slackii TaxID=52774 RepID=A0A3S4SIX8_9ACTO|nr:Uncharacterised protein [Actinomyces slackii]